MLHFSFKCYNKLSKEITVGTATSMGKGTCWQGAENISSLFKMFPNCEHNRYTFTVDLLYFSVSTDIIFKQFCTF